MSHLCSLAMPNARHIETYWMDISSCGADVCRHERMTQEGHGIYCRPVAIGGTSTVRSVSKNGPYTRPAGATGAHPQATGQPLLYERNERSCATCARPGVGTTSTPTLSSAINSARALSRSTPKE